MTYEPLKSGVYLDGDVKDDDITAQLYAVDASPFYCPPLCVVFPKNTDDVVRVVRFASAHRVPVRPRGAGTSTGSLSSGIVLDFTKYMRQLVCSDEETVTVQPGIFVRRVNGILENSQQRHIAGISGNPNSTTIGGVLARNGNGLYALRDGNIAGYVQELKVVLSNGDILCLHKDKPVVLTDDILSEMNTAIRTAQEIVYGKEYFYARELQSGTKHILTERVFRSGVPVHLLPLFLGSGGTLGIIVEAVIKTVPIPQRGETHILFFGGIKKAAAAVKGIAESGCSVCELLDRRRLTLLGENNPSFKGMIPPDTEAVLLVEGGKLAAENNFQHSTINVQLFDTLLRQNVFILQRLRSNIRTVPFFRALSAGVDLLEELVSTVNNAVQEHQITVSFSGHAGVGEIEVMPLADVTQPETYTKLQRFSKTLKELEVDHCQLSAVKSQLFDPAGILRPAELYHWKYAQPLPDDPQSKRQLHWESDTAAELSGRCSNCGECFQYDRRSRVCPVFRGSYRVNDSPKNKCSFIRGIVSGNLHWKTLMDPIAAELADSCSQCRMCEDDCPSQINIAQLAFEIKSAYAAGRGLGLDEMFLSRLDAVLNVIVTLGIPANYLLRNRFVRWLLDKTVQLPQEQTIPALAKLPFLRELRLSRWIQPPQINYHGKDRVALHIDTNTNFFRPEVAKRTIQLLELNGISVEIPDHQKPAGISAFITGNKALAEKLARYNTAAAADYIRRGYQVLTIDPRSASCVKYDYRYVIDNEDSALVAENVQDVCTFLWKRYQQKISSFKFHISSEYSTKRIAYHVPCRSLSLNRLRVDEPTPAEQLLRLAGVDVCRLECGCCGGGGLFGYRAKHYRQSLQIGTPLFKAVKAIDVAVSECPQCCLQIAHGSRKPAVHPVMVLSGEESAQGRNG